MCGVTHSYVRHDSRATWLIHMCNMTHSYVRHDSFICATWLIHMCDMTRVMAYKPWIRRLYLRWIQSNLKTKKKKSLFEKSLCGVHHVETWLIHRRIHFKFIYFSKNVFFAKEMCTWLRLQIFVLQCVAVCCSVLRCVAVCCKHTATHTATHCDTLQHTATHCNTLQHTAGWCIHVFNWWNL